MACTDCALILIIAQDEGIFFRQAVNVSVCVILKAIFKIIVVIARPPIGI